MSTIKPGLHWNLPNEDYHADTEWMSSSVLKRQIPERYKVGGSQDALDFGTLFHTVVLEPDNLGEYVVLDAEKIGLKSDGTVAANPTMTQAWKRAVAEAEQDGKIVVAQADWDKAHAMRDAAAKHSRAASLLFDMPGESEVSAFWQASDGLRHKARFDRLISGAVVDLKSTSTKPGADSLTRACLDYGYDLSAAHYLAVAAGLELDASAFEFVFVGKEAPYYVTVCSLDDDFLARGEALRTLAIERLVNPDVPPYDGADEHLTLAMPPYARITRPLAGVPADFTWSLNDYA